jgi:hypothetical protein
MELEGRREGRASASRFKSPLDVGAGAEEEEARMRAFM